MATQQHVDWVDDIDGTTVLDPDTDAIGFRFAVDGELWEVDTTAANADAFRAFAEKFKVRKVGKLPKAGPYLVNMTPTPGRPDESRAIREWARANGYELNDRGRIPVKVVEAYDNRDKRKKAPTGTTAAPTPAAAPKTPMKPPVKRSARATATTRAPRKTTAQPPTFTAEADTESA